MSINANILDEIFRNPIAHRGLHDKKNGVIENSQTAFANAIKAGYGIECDLQLSGDGEPMVFHDDDLNRLTNQTGAVTKLSAGQLAHISLKNSKNSDVPQTFFQLLEQVAGKVPLIVEIKNQKSPEDKTTNDKANLMLAQAAVNIAKNYNGPLVFKSFYPKMLQNLRQAGFTGPIGIIITKLQPKSSMFRETSPLQRLVIHNLLHYMRCKFDFISCDCNHLDLPAVRLFRNFGFKTMTWTVSSQKIEQKTRGFADQLVFENYLPYRAKS